VGLCCGSSATLDWPRDPVRSHPRCSIKFWVARSPNTSMNSMVHLEQEHHNSVLVTGIDWVVAEHNGRSLKHDHPPSSYTLSFKQVSTSCLVAGLSLVCQQDQPRFQALFYLCDPSLPTITSILPYPDVDQLDASFPLEFCGDLFVARWHWAWSSVDWQTTESASEVLCQRSMFP
jgi:hypothetical protein